mgnify:CR=1 FL=1
MKIDNEMRYPHPVLSEFSRDYMTGAFDCGFSHQMTARGELKIDAELMLNSKPLQVLVGSGDCATGYFVVCRRTFFNFLQAAPLGRSEKFFDVSKLFGAITLRPVVWTVRRIDGYSTPEFDAEFGSDLEIPKGTIVALGPEFRFTMDKKRFKPFESIFELQADSSVKEDEFRVDPTRPKIVISAAPETYKKLASMRNLPAGKKLLMGSVYLPAVMDVIAQLRGGGASLTEQGWYRVFKAKCDELAINPTSESISPLEAAQKLLRAPLKHSVKLAEDF